MKCRICNNELNNKQYTVREMLFGTRDEFNYFKCNDCGCLQISEIPKDIAKYYPKDYGCHRDLLGAADTLRKIRYNIGILKNKHIPENTLLDKFIPFRFEYMLKAIKSGYINTSSKILDIGCGSGEVLKYMYNLGYTDVTGVEPFLENSYKDIKFHRCFIQEFVTDEKFDFILLDHSFEHMPNPKEVLRCIQYLLSPSGICMIRIPTVSSKAWELFGENWIQLDAPRHFFLYSIKSMQLLCENAGLKIDNIYCDSTVFQFVGSEQYMLDIPFNAENSYYTNPKKSRYEKSMIKSFEERAKYLNENDMGDQIVIYIKNVI